MAKVEISSWNSANKIGSAEAPGIQIKGEKRKCSFLLKVMIYLSPKPSQPILTPIFLQKKGK
jgi:hypothetical protein